MKTWRKPKWGEDINGNRVPVPKKRYGNDRVPAQDLKLENYVFVGEYYDWSRFYDENGDEGVGAF
jgi:hypothetical protein